MMSEFGTFRFGVLQWAGMVPFVAELILLLRHMKPVNEGTINNCIMFSGSLNCLIALALGFDLMTNITFLQFSILTLPGFALVAFVGIFVDQHPPKNYTYWIAKFRKMNPAARIVRMVVLTCLCLLWFGAFHFLFSSGQIVNLGRGHYFYGRLMLGDPIYVFAPLLFYSVVDIFGALLLFYTLSFLTSVPNVSKGNRSR